MTELLTIAGTVATIQMVFAGYREWRSARRIVAVRGIDAGDYAKYGCVPLQYAGSRFWAVRVAAAGLGLFSVRPKTRKNAFAARRVVGMREGDEIDYRDIKPRDLLRVMLDDGEHATQFDRSMRRGVASFYRTIALRDLRQSADGASAYCVTVRAQGNLVRSDGDGGLHWLEYKVTSASPRSNLRSGRSSPAEIPEDAIEVVVVPADAYDQAREEANRQHSGKLRRRLLRHNPNPKAALGHVVAIYAIPLTVLVGLGATFLGWAATVAILVTLVAIPLVLLIVLLCFALPPAFFLIVRDRIRARRAPIRPPEPSKPRSGRVVTSLRHTKLPAPQAWTGATARSMSAGRRINGTDARSTLAHLWQQYSSVVLPHRR